MSSKIRFALPLLFIIITIIVLGCSSPEEQGFTLKDVQDIGYQAEEDITKQYWKYDDKKEQMSVNYPKKISDFSNFPQCWYIIPKWL